MMEVITICLAGIGSLTLGVTLFIVAMLIAQSWTVANILFQRGVSSERARMYWAVRCLAKSDVVWEVLEGMDDDEEIAELREEVRKARLSLMLPTSSPPPVNGGDAG